MKRLIVIDMQNDFCTGSLANPDAVAVIPFIKEKIEYFKKMGQGSVIFTCDTHGSDYMNSLEGKNLPVPHCIKGSHGWKIVDDLYDSSAKIIEKPTFGYKNWEAHIQDGDEIYMTGTCTDICVISNALAIKAACPNSEVYVYKDGCAGLTKEKHEHALDVMASCQVKIL